MKLEQIFDSRPLASRTLAYSNTFQLSVTYEMEDKLFEILRQEQTWLDWLSSIGGLGFLVKLANFVVSYTDSPHMFVTSSMLQDDDK